MAAHLLRADTAEWENDGARPPTQAAESSQASINHLLHLLRKGSSRQADVDAALLAAGSVQRKVGWQQWSLWAMQRIVNISTLVF